jgi:hypothetical protein
MQNYTSQTKSQSSAAMRNGNVISYSRNGFWFHVTMNGNIGTDQHGDKYTLHNGKLYAEHSSRVQDVNEEIERMMEEEKERRDVV